MVQVDIKTSANTINFPKNQSLTGDLVLTLHSELTQRTFTFNVTDEGNSKRFYKFTLDLSEVSNGEYDYNINEIETGLIRIGAVELSTPEVVSFSDEVEIVQYGDDRSSQFTLQTKDVEYENNGEYEVNPDNGFYGLKKVNITVNVPDNYESGYTDGYADGYVSGNTDGFNSGYTSGSTDGYNTGYGEGKIDGINEQKSKLTGLNVNQNGTYTREDGYSAITVNVPSGSTINNQNKNVSITANTAMTVTFDAGYTGLGNVGIDVNVPQTGHTDAEMQEAYSSGITKGTNEQKAKLVTTAVTSNGTYTREDGYSSISVNVPTGSTINNQPKNLTYTANTDTYITYDTGYTGLEGVSLHIEVPQTGHTDEELEEKYQSGYTTGYNYGNAVGYNSGLTVGYNSGLTVGYNNGWNDGYNSGKTEGYQSGYTVGYDSGYSNGYTSGSTDGYNSGYAEGYASGETVGYQSGYTVGWSEGYVSGRTDAVDYFTITVNISNETPDLINNAGFVINYLDRSDSYTYTGSPITAQILPGVSFIIIFNEVQNYGKPNNVNGISSWGGSASYNVEYIEQIDYTKEPLTFNIISAGTISLKNDVNASVKSIEYKVNDGEWTVGYFTPSTASTGWTSISVNAGDLIQFRGNNSAYADTVTKGSRFTSTAKYNAYGNVMSLVSKTSFSGLTSVGTLAFARLFNSSGIVSAENLKLPATTLAQSCYYQMFDSSSIEIAPELPATVMVDSCYGGMFQSCTSLTTAPILSHITTLANNCCNAMFKNSGIQRVEVPSAEPISYCYNEMFNGCGSLAYIKCLTSSPNTTQMWNWVKSVAASGTFVKQSGITWTTGDSGIPSGWIVLSE